jgi:hypothetical protein
MKEESDPFLEDAINLRNELDTVATGIHDGSIKLKIVEGRVVMTTEN